MTSKRKRFASESKTIVRKSYLGPAPLLKGEDERDYDLLFQKFVNDLKPIDIIEEIWIQETADFTWEIGRYRRIKSRLISEKLPDCLGDILERYIRRRYVTIQESEPFQLMLASPLPAPPRPVHPAHKLARKWALGDPDATARVHKLMNSQKFAMDDIYARAFMASFDVIERIDRIIVDLEARRNAVFREIDRHRSAFAQSLRREVHQIEDAEFETIEPKKVAPKSAGDKDAA